MGQMTKEDLEKYVDERVRQNTGGPFQTIANAWKLAGLQFNNGSPDGMIVLLRRDLMLKEEAVECHGEHETCSGPEHARAEMAEKARHIVALLWYIADKYGTHIWGDEYEAREAQRRLEGSSNVGSKALSLEDVIRRRVSSYNLDIGGVREKERLILALIRDVEEWLSGQADRQALEAKRTVIDAEA